MTALEYMEKQVQKNYKKYYNKHERGASDEILNNILSKISYYEQAVEALRMENILLNESDETEFDYEVED